MATPAFHDGNILAGPLSGIFSVDVTSAWRRCPGCRADVPVAALHVYAAGPAQVARCPQCQQVALRVSRHSGVLWVDFGAGGALRFPLAEGM
ncbi:DUF6510 family protein [Yinghuangia sp. YIM S09857]|uniref:DUF6510 family protein n=1 Tax=Yinghuangia sp. YIM S09857 TaxID=3436929 RepID=UPI003F53837D